MSTTSVDKVPDVPTDDDASMSFASTRSASRLPSRADRPTAVQQFTDETGAPASLPEIGSGGEESKLKVLMGLMRK